MLNSKTREGMVLFMYLMILAFTRRTHKGIVFLFDVVNYLII